MQEEIECVFVCFGAFALLVEENETSERLQSSLKSGRYELSPVKQRCR